MVRGVGSGLLLSEARDCPGSQSSLLSDKEARPSQLELDESQLLES